MKKLLLTTALMLAASPAFAKEVIVKEVTDANTGKVYFSPDKLTIQTGDTVTFVNAQDDIHEVMFTSVPNGVDEMIMSDTHEKKGDKFSYTFTVPGTYQFHCHPHDAAGMRGTLIVGQASKPGETKASGHHHPAKAESSGTTDSKAAANGIAATGKVVSVDTAKKVVKLKHDPIKALNWPVMTMNFTVDSGVDLSALQAGDAVTFTMKPLGEDDYIINSIKKQ